MSRKRKDRLSSQDMYIRSFQLCFKLLFAQLSWLNILILLLFGQKKLAQIRLQKNNARHINDQEGSSFKLLLYKYASKQLYSAII